MPSPGPRPVDPYRVLGVAPDATIVEVKRAYRALAKRNHPDAVGPAATARFLAIQQAYETISAGRGRPPRAAPATRGERREASADWYAEARDAARGRARQGRGEAQRPAAGASGGAPGATGSAAGARGTRRGGAAGADDAADGTRAGAPAGDDRRRAEEPGRGRGGGRAGRAGPGAGDGPGSRTATIGSTTYDDAVAGEPSWDGASWYGAASGTYWTVNPREYADPRKHGPEYLARAATAARDAAARHAAPHEARRPHDDAGRGTAEEDVADEADRADRGPRARAGRDVPGVPGPHATSSAAFSVVGRLRRLLRPARPDPRVR